VKEMKKLYKRIIMECYDNQCSIYDRWRYSGEGGKVFLKIQINMVLGMFQAINNRLFLDLGTGTGKYAVATHALGGEIIGLDFSVNMLKKVKDESSNNILLINADVEHLPFRSEIFDGVSAIRLIGMVQDRKLAFSEMNRVLKKGGRLIFNFHSPSSFISRIGRIYRVFSSQHRETKKLTTHDLSYWEMINEIESVNFKVQDTSAVWLHKMIYDRIDSKFFAFLAIFLEKILSFIPSNFATLVFICVSKKQSLR